MALAAASTLSCVQIGFARRGRADQRRLIGLAHMQGRGVGLGIDGEGADPHAFGGAEHPAGDLAAIGDQDGFEHQNSTLAGDTFSEIT
jgi:hypothetical protein